MEQFLTMEVDALEFSFKIVHSTVFETTKIDLMEIVSKTKIQKVPKDNVFNFDLILSYFDLPLANAIFVRFKKVSKLSNHTNLF